MQETENPAFLVNTSDDQIIIKIKDRVSYLNAGPLNQFFDSVIAKGSNTFIIDFRDCSSMDSTFLGILASAALATRKSSGKITLVNLSVRNLELIKNLGLHQITIVDETDYQDYSIEERMELLDGNKTANKETILSAHETLAELNEKNAQSFEAVLECLHEKTEETR